jgi:hypothetical protein
MEHNRLSEILEERTVIENTQLDKFFETLGKTGRIQHSAAAAGIPWAYLQEVIKASPEFGQRVEAAKARYGETLQEVAHRLCTEGQERIVLGGKNRDEVHYEYVIPVPLLIEELKRTLPEQYVARTQPSHKLIQNNTQVNNKVIVVPQQQSMDDWIKEQELQNIEKKPLDELRKLGVNVDM